MQLSFNYGLRRYFISDNYFYLLLFIFFLIVFLKQKQRRNVERKTPISDLNYRGGSNSEILQKLYDQCLSENLYVEVNDNRVKQIIRKMLNIQANKPVIISASVYLLAILKNRNIPLVLQHKGTELIIENFRGFMSKGLGTILFAKLLAIGSGPILVGSIPLILTAIIYSSLHVDCNSFVDTLPKISGDLQYIETPINDDAPIIVAPHTSKILYHEFDETKASSLTSLSCYVRGNCLGPESIQRRSPSKSTRFVPLSQRTKTLSDLKESSVNEIDEIDVNNVNYKQEN